LDWSVKVSVQRENKERRNKERGGESRLIYKSPLKARRWKGGSERLQGIHCSGIRLGMKS